jgi:putative hydrolase of the HAD superfamily
VFAFDAVLFDLDDTLCRHEQSAETIYYGAFEHAGVDPVGRPTDLWEALDGDPPPGDPTDYLADGFAQVLTGRSDTSAPVGPHEETADGSDERAAARRLAEGFRETVDYRAVSFVPGAERALTAARERGLVGLVTNGPASRQRVKLDALGIAEAFDVVVYAGDLPRRKPEPDPFEEALDALDVRAGATLYVGDSVEHDVVGAHRAGLPVAWVGGSEGWDGQRWAGVERPTYVLERIDALSGVLDGASGTR